MPALQKIYLSSLVMIVLVMPILGLRGQGRQHTQELPDSTAKSKELLMQLERLPVDKITAKYEAMEASITKGLLKQLGKIEKREASLKKAVSLKDSLKASVLFSGTSAKLAQLKEQVKKPSAYLNKKLGGNYIPTLDSLQSLGSFLGNHKLGAQLPAEQLKKLKGMGDQLGKIQMQLNTAQEIKTYIAAHKQELQTQLQQLGVGKALRQYKEQAYYYQQQLKEYQAMLKDPDKIARRALELVRNTPAYKDFMQRHSQLAQLFNLPGTGAASGSGATGVEAIAGLQTRVMLTQQIAERMGSAGGGSASGMNPQQYIEQQVGQARGELNALKEKINQAGGGADELEMPDFKPNNQKTKSFLKRLEFGINIQSQRLNRLLPTMSDIALQAGYKLNDKSVVGLGIAYKLGWGKGLNEIRLSNEGVGLRTYTDIKLKGSIWITGGYELNYQRSFNSVRELEAYGSWQRSGLLGLSKKYSIGKKKGNMQLLWDFLSYSQVPRTRAIQFRLGYTL